MSDEYIIGFTDENQTWRELTFRGVSEQVAVALAQGLNRAPFGNVTLTAAERVEVNLDAAGGTGGTGGGTAPGGAT